MDGGAPESCVASYGHRELMQGSMVVFDPRLRNSHMMGIQYSCFPGGLRLKRHSILANTPECLLRSIICYVRSPPQGSFLIAVHLAHLV